MSVTRPGTQASFPRRQDWRAEAVRAPICRDGALRLRSPSSPSSGSTSATLQAWATQPRGVYGGSASKTSLIEPRQASLEVRHEALQEAARAPARSSGWTFSQASTNGPISQAQTVPWW